MFEEQGWWEASQAGWWQAGQVEQLKVLQLLLWQGGEGGRRDQNLLWKTGGKFEEEKSWFGSPAQAVVTVASLRLSLAIAVVLPQGNSAELYHLHAACNWDGWAVSNGRGKEEHKRVNRGNQITELYNCTKDLANCLVKQGRDLSQKT